MVVVCAMALIVVYDDGMAWQYGIVEANLCNYIQKLNSTPIVIINR